VYDSREKAAFSTRLPSTDLAAQLRAQGDLLERAMEALQQMADAYQPHVMEQRCRVCDSSWSHMREMLAEWENAKA